MARLSSSMNPSAILGVLLGFAALGSYAVWERGDAEHWKAQYATLQASYQTAAISAKADALKQETQDKAFIQEQSNKAIQQAQAGQKQAQDALQIYLAKGNAASRGKVDAAHACFNTPIPAEDIP